MSNRKVIAVSGGFDPVHVGHLRMFESASLLGELVVIVNSDEWLHKKKGYQFMEFEDRCEIIRGFRCVSHVVGVKDNDGTVCSALREINPDYFANGGDRIDGNTPEKDLCEDLGIEMVWSVGGKKIRSSSIIVEKSKNSDIEK